MARCRSVVAMSGMIVPPRRISDYTTRMGRWVSVGAARSRHRAKTGRVRRDEAVGAVSFFYGRSRAGARGSALPAAGLRRVQVQASLYLLRTNKLRRRQLA